MLNPALDGTALLHRIADALDMSVEQLLRFPDHPPAEHAALADLYRVIVAVQRVDDVRLRRRLVQEFELAV